MCEWPPALLVFSPVIAWIIAAMVGIVIGFRWWPFAVSIAYSVCVIIYIQVAYLNGCS